VHRTASTQRTAASKLGTGQSNDITQHPEQRHLFWNFKIMTDGVNDDRDHKGKIPYVRLERLKAYRETATIAERAA
jgi:hypothetical protein